MRDGRVALVGRLLELSEQLSDHVARPDPDVKSSLASSNQFHFAIDARCGNEELLSVIELLWMRYGLLLNFILTIKLSPEDLRSHRDMISAVTRKDVDAACRALTADLEDSASRKLKSLLGASSDFAETPRQTRRS